MKFGHPPARCARVPLRFAKGGGNGVLCVSLVSRVRGNDVAGVAVNYGHPPARCARVPLRFAKGGESLSPTPTAVESLVSAEVSKRFLGVEHHSDVMFRGVVFGESVGECVGFVGTLHAV